MKGQKLWRRFMLIGVAVIFGSFSFSAVGQTDKTYQEMKREKERASLKGVKTIQVLVERFAPEIGIDNKEIQTMAELKLRTIGVKITNDLFYPQLYIHSLHVPVDPDRRLPFFFTVSIEFNQPGVLIRDKQLPLPPEYDIVTWSRVQTGAFAKEHPTLNETSVTKEFLSRYLDEFCNDYLAANPKE